MKFHYMGKFDGSFENLPTREHEEGYVPFKEPSEKSLPLVINIIAFAVTVALIIPVFVFGMAKNEGYAPGAEGIGTLKFLLIWCGICVLSFAVIFPHECLHALCFRGDVYMYTNFNKGLCFVVGPELFSKGRFVFMSLLPNLVFGLIPYVIWIFFPGLWYIGAFGALTVGMGGGDYMNVVNCLIQVPRGAKTYMHGMNSFWVKTEKEI